MDFLVALVVSIACGLLIGWMLLLRYKSTSYALVSRHVAVLIAVLLYAFYLFARIGISIWSVTIIPLLTLLITFVLVRSAILRLLELK